MRGAGSAVFAAILLLIAGHAYGRVIGIIGGSLGAIAALLSVGGCNPWWSLGIFVWASSTASSSTARTCGSRRGRRPAGTSGWPGCEPERAARMSRLRPVSRRRSRLLIAYDGSDLANAAVRGAAELFPGSAALVHGLGAGAGRNGGGGRRSGRRRSRPGPA
jgi:hypothetical protein